MDITAPNQYQFFRISYIIQATSKPTKSCVLYDNVILCPDELLAVT